MTAGATTAMPIEGIRRPLACTECRTELRGRVVQSRGFGLIFKERGAAVRGGDWPAGWGGGHVGAQFMFEGAIGHVVLFVSVQFQRKIFSSAVCTMYRWRSLSSISLFSVLGLSMGPPLSCSCTLFTSACSGLLRHAGCRWSWLLKGRSDGSGGGGKA